MKAFVAGGAAASGQKHEDGDTHFITRRPIRPPRPTAPHLVSSASAAAPHGASPCLIVIFMVLGRVEDIESSTGFVLQF